MALRIDKFAGNGPGLWLRMQQNYDIRHAERQMKEELFKIKTVSKVGNELCPSSAEGPVQLPGLLPRMFAAPETWRCAPRKIQIDK